MSESVENKTKLVVTDSVLESPEFALASDDTYLKDSNNSSDGSQTPQSDRSRESASQPGGPQESSSPAPTFAHVGGVDFSNPMHAETVLKDLSADEFMRLIEGASPEELQSLLIAVDKPKTTSRPISSAFARLFEPLEQKDVTFLKILGWWESRRLFYNVVVGLTGVCSLMVIRVTSMNHIFSGGFLGGFLIMAYAAVMTAIAANICYTIGCVCDAFARHFWKEKAEDFAPILYSLGLIFSLMVVGAPSLLLLTFL